MSAWSEILEAVEPLEDLAFDSNVVERLAASEKTLPGIHFYTPTFKSYATSEIKDCGRSAWPAISITGGDCKLNCDHCKAKILEPMIPARSPEDLWRAVNGIVEQGAGGMLLTGGSNHRNEVEYDRYYPTIRRIKDEFSHFRIAMHTALVDSAMAARMADAGIDAAMMDVIGAQDTITQVYHLRRSVDDFERALEALTATSMKVVPHIVIGLHYGQLLGEWNALEIVARHRPSALVLVVVMPTYAAEPRPFATPDPHEVGQFFGDARAILPDVPLLLGCARPAGSVKGLIDAYAVMAGVDGMAHPSDGMVELAARLDRSVRVTPACCSIAVGEEVMAIDGLDAGLEIDLAEIVRHERERRAARKRQSVFGEIKVVGGEERSSCCGT
ncbi:radical SAM protein [Acidiferrobacter sp.]|uniref:radical SAM protein n=2 Tax=Acidiferrobacter sp. TaxID=1872107 RepID=UPI0026148482|nr:radical SAM protein [Acidiferrobacter sp.]